MIDKFRDRSSGLESPGHSAIEVTPNDAADMAIASRALYIGQAGDLKITTVGGDVVTFTAVPVGLLPMRVRRVHATGTTAGAIVAIW